MLTAEQITERKKGIGASDARRIIDGDWWSLWNEKTGRTESEDLSGVWPVQLGSCTENLNLDWYERKTGRVLTRRQEHIVSAEYPMLRCTLDGFDPAIPAVVEAKHVNGFSKMPDVIERYMPQVMHQMVVAETPHAFLSVIVGANEPAVIEIEYDEFWTMTYIDRAKEFWSYVESGKEPPGAPQALSAPIPVETMRVVDMKGSNEWASAAGEWLESRVPAKKFEASVKAIKALVEADVREAFGYGIVATRDKRGVSIKET